MQQLSKTEAMRLIPIGDNFPTSDGKQNLALSSRLAEPIVFVIFSKKRSVTSRRKQPSAFDQVYEFDRGRIVAYRDCGLSFREIDSHVGRNQTTVMRICNRWMQEGTTDRRGRSHPPQCTTSREDRQIARMAQSGLSARCPLLGLPLTQNHRRLRRQWCDERSMWAAEWNEVVFNSESRICLQHHDGRIRVWRHRGERMLNSFVMHRHTGPAPGIMVWGGIGYHSRTPLVRIAGTLSSQRYISRGVGASFPSLPSGLGHTWHALSKGSSSITRLNCFPGRLVLRIFRR
ncbi:transposable element Tcb1 transposase [Trichonephila clavipes]|nr:transposable element Tcb1 transposase [Trichonephila clavipes]